VIRAVLGALEMLRVLGIEVVGLVGNGNEFLAQSFDFGV